MESVFLPVNQFSKIKEILNAKKLVFEIVRETENSMVIAFDVWVKPGSKFEKKFVGDNGVLIIQTRSRPVEGEANISVIALVSELMGVTKSAVEIVRGEKSRNKRLLLLIELNIKKDKSYYEAKFSEISV